MSVTVALRIAGRSYEVSCDDGQEGRLVDLAVEIDRRAQQLLRAVGPVSDARLLVMVALTLMDDLALCQENAGMAPPGVDSDFDSRLAAGLDRLSHRIETIAEWVQKT